MRYAAVGVFEGAEHDDAFDLVVVAGVPKMVEGVLQRCLREDRVMLYRVLDWPHEAGIDVEVVNLVVDRDPVVLVCMGMVVQAWTLLYLSFCRSLVCAT